MSEVITSDPIEKYVAWENSRRRKSGRFELPVKGWGWPPGLLVPGESATLWLPAPRADRATRRFENGRRVTSRSRGVDDVPELQELRRRVFMDLRLVGAAEDGERVVWNVADAFEDYALALLQFNYEFNDVELAAVLDGDRWHSPIVQHLCGGSDAIELMTELAPAFAAAAGVTEAQLALVPPELNSAPPESSHRPSLWQRAARLITRRNRHG